ncbi:MFS transporter [Virgisporangium ochraceum]|uniref:MFS transporter n=1 Tax=Virgisporangium ochraceum TaxID=65505 RepID=A0A8J3ZXY7_9ACTN|nr:MFS transporter [Virgisporangium ochraceum]GIJ72152.1 MFS transporter [Virgisporangium ochraceum]
MVNRRGWAIVAAFAVTQTVGFGVLYYAFAVLLRPMALALDASTAVVTGALTASVLAGAVLSVPVGRWLDRHGGRALMTTGSLLATGLVVAWSQVRTVAQLYAVLIGIGLATAMVLYETALTVVVSWFDPPHRGRAVLAVVIVAGFASTIFMPLTAALVDRWGWRTALLVLAGVHGALTVPLHAFLVRPPPALRARDADPAHAGTVRAAVRDPRFWFLATAFVAHSAAMATMAVHLVGFLVHSGHPAVFAASVAGLLGVMSVTGRLLLTAAHRRWRLTTVVTVVFAVQGAGAFVLPLVAASPAGAAVGVTAFGIGFGVASLARPQLLADRYGTLAYGTINGILATPVTVSRAVAPAAAAGLLGVCGYGAVLAGVGAACLVAAVGIAARAGTPPPVARSAEPR